MMTVGFYKFPVLYFYIGFQRVLNFNAGLDFYPASWFFCPLQFFLLQRLIQSLFSISQNNDHHYFFTLAGLLHLQRFHIGILDNFHGLDFYPALFIRQSTQTRDRF